METVESLRKKGYKVKVYHLRKFIPACLPNTWSMKDYYELKLTVTLQQIWKLSCCGGATTVVICGKDNGMYFGHAYCSDKDNYDKKIGVKIALGRALKSMGSENN